MRPLFEGDQMGCAEFLRRWEAMPEVKHAELPRAKERQERSAVRFGERGSRFAILALLGVTFPQWFSRFEQVHMEGRKPDAGIR